MDSLNVNPQLGTRWMSLDTGWTLVPSIDPAMHTVQVDAKLNQSINRLITLLTRHEVFLRWSRFLFVIFVILECNIEGHYF